MIFEKIRSYIVIYSNPNEHTRGFLVPPPASGRFLGTPGVFSGLQRPSGALGVSWGLLGPSGASLSLFSFPWTFLGRPGDPSVSCSFCSRLLFSTPSWCFLATPGAFLGVLEPPGTSWGLLGPSWASLGLLGLLGFPGPRWSLLGLPGPRCSLLELP